MENQLPKRLQKHVVECPHCGGQALDHMTKCPKCQGELIPHGYTPAINEKTAKRIKLILGIILSAAAIIYIIHKFKA